MLQAVTIFPTLWKYRFVENGKILDAVDGWNETMVVQR